MTTIRKALLYSIVLLALTVLTVHDASAQMAADNSRRASNIVTTFVQGRAAGGQTLSTDQVRQADEFVQTDETGNNNRRVASIALFPTRTRTEVIEESRLDRRRTRRRQRQKLSEIAGTEVERPQLSETMPFPEGSQCELSSLDYVFYPDNNAFTVTPPWTADISESDKKTLYFQACECGWQMLPRSMCINLTEWELMGRTQIYLPGFTSYTWVFK